MPYRRCRFARLWAVCMILAVTALSPQTGPAAQEPTSFASGRVAVDVTAGSAAAARDQAIEQGRVQAFNKMLRNLTAAEDHGRLPNLDPATIASMETGFEVADEKTSDVRYIATLTFQFDPNGVRELLQKYGIAFVEGRSRPMVVIPVLQVEGANLLWEEQNPWRDAWSQQADQSALVPLVLPIGDLVDISKLSAAQALAGDQDALAALAQRYQATDTLVVVASETSEALRATASRYGPNGAAQVAAVSIEGPGPGALELAAANIDEQVEEQWKRQNLVRADIGGRINVIVPVQTLSDWTLVRRRLDAIGAVRSASLTRLQRGQAEIVIDFVGTIGQLQRAMGRNDLDLREGLSTWVLSLRGLPAPTAGGGIGNEPLNAPAPPVAMPSPPSATPDGRSQ
jgi:hypothetical protein